MIRINLLPVREINAESSRRRELTVAGVSLAATVLLLLGAYLYQSSQLSKLTNELAAMRKDIEVLNGKIKEVGNLENKIKEFRSKHKVIEDLSNQKIGPVRVMDSLAAAIPSTLWLTELKQSGGNLLINGLATDNQSVAEFVRSLSRSAHFKNVELIESTQTDEKTGPFKKFSIQSGISYETSTTAGGAPSPSQAATKEKSKS
ncbi:MAG: PilN domain-containing protein [Candidatus Binatia bacterium]